MSDNINHPDRYNSNGYECIGVMEAIFGLEAVKAFCKLNAFKYIWRADKKGHTEDLKKAVFYLNHYIELEEKGESKNEAEIKRLNKCVELEDQRNEKQFSE